MCRRQALLELNEGGCACAPVCGHAREPFQISTLKKELRNEHGQEGGRGREGYAACVQKYSKRLQSGRWQLIATETKGTEAT